MITKSHRKILKITKDNVKFKVASNTFQDELVWKDYQTNKWEKDFFKTFFKIKNINKYIFVDVGASNGCLSLYAAHFCKKVLSLEPDTRIFNQLKINLKLNKKNITALNLALNIKNGKINSNQSDNFSSIMFSTLKKKIIMQAITFEELCKKYIKNNKFFLKIDIEGYEFTLLNDNNFYELLKINKPPIYLAIHIGAGPLFKYKNAPFKFLQRFYNLSKTFCEYKLLYKLLLNYKKIEIDGVPATKLFFFNPSYYRKGVNIFMYN
jgi:FkbM family methyltransferase